MPTCALTVVDPVTTEGPTQPTQRVPLEHTALANSGECAAGPHEQSST